MGDREGRPYAGLVAGLFGCRGDACRRPRYRARRARPSPMPFPHGLVWVGTDATRAWNATSHEGNEAVLDSGWATARVAPTRASSPGCSGVGATLSRPQGAPSPMPVSRWPRSGRYGSRKGVARHFVRRKRSRAGFGMGDREGRPRVAPTRASSPGCSGVGATLVVAHACRRPRYRARRARRRSRRLPDGFVWVGTGAARAWHATSYEGNEAVLDSGWATARVAPTMGIARHHASLV